MTGSVERRERLKRRLHRYQLWLDRLSCLEGSYSSPRILAFSRRLDSLVTEFQRLSREDPDPGQPADRSKPADD